MGNTVFRLLLLLNRYAIGLLRSMLDESWWLQATSALKTGTERGIQSSLRMLCESEGYTDRLRLVVAHRLSTLVGAVCRQIGSLRVRRVRIGALWKAVAHCGKQESAFIFSLAVACYSVYNFAFQRMQHIANLSYRNNANESITY